MTRRSAPKRAGLGRLRIHAAGFEPAAPAPWRTCLGVDDPIFSQTETPLHNPARGFERKVFRHTHALKFLQEHVR
jgi:hypothetical protein